METDETFITDDGRVVVNKKNVPELHVIAWVHGEKCRKGKGVDDTVLKCKCWDKEGFPLITWVDGLE